MEYDRPELLAPGRQEELLADLRERTFLPIDKVRVSSIDLPQARATLNVWYVESPG